MREIFFLSGLPRAGNTLLSSIINETNSVPNSYREKNNELNKSN